MPVYLDPCKHFAPPTLLAGLMALPARIGLQPLENQTTAILAWLLGRSDEFARSFCRLFLPDEAAEVVEASPKIGVRTWITLPSLPKTGKLFPDLSLEGCAGLFQLLVEVKVDAGLHAFATIEGAPRQPEAYIRSWEQERTGAKTRAVGTLTRDGPGYAPPSHEWRARDVKWNQVRRLVGSSHFPEGVAVVADEFRAVLDATIVPVEVTMSEQLRVWATAFHQAAATGLKATVQVTKLGNVQNGKDYSGRYFWLVSPDALEYRLWLAVTEKNARYNQPLYDASVWISSADNERLPVEVGERLQAAGFSWLKDRDGWVRWRRGEQVAALLELGSLEAQAAEFVRELASDLVSAGLAVRP